MDSTGAFELLDMWKRYHRLKHGMGTAKNWETKEIRMMGAVYYNTGKSVHKKKLLSE